MASRAARRSGEALARHAQSAEPRPEALGTRHYPRSLDLDMEGNICSMPEFSFTLWEKDPDRPWIVLGEERHTATLGSPAEFFAWTQERWPSDRFKG